MRARTAVGLLLVVLALAAPATAWGAGAGSLTHRYPLGTSTLCCQTSTTAPARSGTTSPAPTTPRSTGASHHRTGGGGWRTVLIVIVAELLLVVVVAVHPVLRSSQRSTPRRRHEIGPGLLIGLRPLLRYDPGREAWILRAIGDRRGPVLRRRDRDSSRVRRRARPGTSR